MIGHISYNDAFVKVTRFDDMSDGSMAKDITLKGFEPVYYISYGESYENIAEQVAYALDVEIVLHIKNLNAFIVFGEAVPAPKTYLLGMPSCPTCGFDCQGWVAIGRPCEGG